MRGQESELLFQQVPPGGFLAAHQLRAGPRGLALVGGGGQGLTRGKSQEEGVGG